MRADRALLWRACSLPINAIIWTLVVKHPKGTCMTEARQLK